MGLELRITTNDHRFLPGQNHATLAAVMAPITPTNDSTPQICENGSYARVARPRASCWLWHPWYARLWWAGAVVYWTGMAASLEVGAFDAFYTSALAGFLNIAFFPPLLLMVLGLGYARAWFAWSDWEFVEPTHELMFPKRSVGGMRDPASDPLDPRSGLHWQHFHRRR